MLNDLPDDGALAAHLLAQLAADLPDRLSRYRYIIALDDDFGEGSHVMLPGGHAAWSAFTEARNCWVAGDFAAVVLLSQAVVEQVLAGWVGLIESVAPIHGLREPRDGYLPSRPMLRKTIEKAKEVAGLADADVRDIQRLADLRNPLSHFRSIDETSNLDNRAMATGVHPMRLLYEDARFAITTALRTVHQASRWTPEKT